ncbi:hypothetical protein M5J14_23880, partial [Lysinibacillus sp. OL1_EC]|uniref:hypothetical protein n=1 Tax=Lysinibacillus sp. OL1_EC TaxID=2943493 RepID=UPI00202F3DCF
MAEWELIEETASPYRDTNETTTKIGVTLINGTTDYLQLNYATSMGSGMMGKFSTLPIAEYAKAESYLYKIDIHKKVDGVAGPIESTILFTFRNIPAEGQTIGLFAPDITVSKENIYMPFGTGNMISRLYRKALNTNGKVKDQIPGTLIKFAGSIWTILEPTTGYLYKNDSVLQRNFDAENYKYFVPTRVTGLAYWLNNGYFDSFAIQDKAAIKTKEWGTGGEGNENGTLVSAKIGLLSFSEKNRYIDQLKILSPPTSEMWMRTYHGDASKVYTVLPTGGAYLAHATNDKKAVHPTLYIDPEISIKNGAIVHNTAPIASLTSPSNNQMLYENDTLNITGDSYDPDKDQSV